jgi:pimeloyl-ACP methyl ester carboxylesterase
MAAVPYEELLLAPKGPVGRFYAAAAAPAAADAAAAPAAADAAAAPPPAARAIVCVGGVGGGWDSPACGLYPRLCEVLAAQGYAHGLRVRFRVPTDVTECAADVVEGLEWLRGRGVAQAALLGHSLGGAVVVAAAAAAASLPGRAPRVRAVVPLATQLAGATAPAAQLPQYTRMLAIHADDDATLPPACSERLVRAAALPADHKSLRILRTGGHGLQGGGVEEAVFTEVQAFLKAAFDAPD